MNIAIMDYGMGNLRSVQKAFEFVGFSVEVTSDYQKIISADKLVVPGVGAFRDAIATLKNSGLDEAILEANQRQKIILGICLGMQLLFDISYENGEYEGLKLLRGEIVRFHANTKEKVPHVGWNSLHFTKSSPLFTKTQAPPYVYFVHSYHLHTTDEIVNATTFYGSEIQVAVWRNNIFATQFHPEKSGAYGLSIIKNFAEL